MWLMPSKRRPRRYATHAEKEPTSAMKTSARIMLFRSVVWSFFKCLMRSVCGKFWSGVEAASELNWVRRLAILGEKRQSGDTDAESVWLG